MVHLKLSRGERQFQRLDSGDYLCCNGGKDAPSPPDFGPVASASEANARFASEAAKEQIQWARDQWAEQREMIQQVTDVQLPIMELQAEMAGQGMNAYLNAMEMQQSVAWENHKNAMEDRDRYERVFQPIENDLVQEFMAYDTEGRKAMEAGQAQSDVARAQDAQRKQAVMSLEGYGIDPSQTRSQALDATLRTQQASAQAAAGNQARKNVENTGRALRAEAINIGRGLPSNVAASYNTALGAGQGAQVAHSANMGALGNTMQGLGQNASAWQGAGNAMGGPTSWMGQGNQALGQWGNTMNQGFQNQLGAANFGANNSLWANMSPVLGAGLGFAGRAFFAEGGEIEGPGGPKDDMVPAQLSDGEFVIPEEVVRRKGTEFFDKLIDKTKEEVSQREQQSAAEQEEARVRKTAMEMEVPAEHPQHLGYGGPVYPYDSPQPNPGGPVFYAEGGPVYDGARGYAPGGYGDVYEDEYWAEPVQEFAEGGAVRGIPMNMDYGYHGNQMSQPISQLETPQEPQPGTPQALQLGEQPTYMAEGGEAKLISAPAGNLYSGRNPRPMFGYDSAAAQQGKKMQQAAATNRARLLQDMQQQMAAKKWQNVQPDWQPANFERIDFNLDDAIERARQGRLDEATAQREHEMAMQQQAFEAAMRQAQLAQQNPPPFSGYSRGRGYDNRSYNNYDPYGGMD